MSGISRWDGKQVKSWRRLVGKRCLVIRDRFYGSDATEVTVVEVSPSGGRVKFRWPSTSESWEDSQSYLLIEVLAEVSK